MRRKSLTQGLFDFAEKSRTQKPGERPIWLTRIDGPDIAAAKRSRVLIGFNQTNKRGAVRTKLFKKIVGKL